MQMIQKCSMRTGSQWTQMTIDVFVTKEIWIWIRTQIAPIYVIILNSNMLKASMVRPLECPFKSMSARTNASLSNNATSISNSITFLSSNIKTNTFLNSYSYCGLDYRYIESFLKCNNDIKLRYCRWKQISTTGYIQNQQRSKLLEHI